MGRVYIVKLRLDYLFHEGRGMRVDGQRMGGGVNDRWRKVFGVFPSGEKGGAGNRGDG